MIHPIRHQPRTHSEEAITHLQEINAIRKKKVAGLLRYKAVMGAGLALMVGSVIAVVAGGALTLGITIALLLGIAMWLTAAILWYFAEDELRSFLRNNVYRKIFSGISPTIEYEPSQFIDPKEAAQSQLFPKDNNYAYGSGLIRGTYGQTEFVCSHIEIPGRSTNSSEPEFSGLFLIADFNKHLKGTTLVLPDKLENALGRRLGRKIQKMLQSELELVQLEDPEFERAFKVLSHDQVEGRYILTPNFMQRLVALQRNIYSRLRIAFKDGRVYVFIEGVNGLDVGYQQELHLSQVSDNAHYRYSLITQVIDALELNERIWMKE